MTEPPWQLGRQSCLEDKPSRERKGVGKRQNVVGWKTVKKEGGQQGKGCWLRGVWPEEKTLSGSKRINDGRGCDPGWYPLGGAKADRQQK